MTDRRLFRQLVESPDILVLPGVFNGYSVRLVERFGFKAAAITGAGISESVLGWADRGILTFDENLRACRALADCCTIPLLADADTGYGNALNVHFVTRAFEQAGLTAISIEDQVWPKRCGHLSGKAVIPAQEMADKVKAACDARRDGDFMIRARTDAAATDGIPEVIDRLNLYGEAGADIVFADALLSVEDIATVAKNVNKPLAVNMGFGLIERGTTPLVTPRRLQELGVATVSYARMLTSAALRGMMNALEAFAPTIKADKPTQRPDLMVPFGELNELMGLEDAGRARSEMDQRMNHSRENDMNRLLNPTVALACCAACLDAGAGARQHRDHGAGGAGRRLRPHLACAAGHHREGRPGQGHHRDQCRRRRRRDRARAVHPQQVRTQRRHDRRRLRHGRVLRHQPLESHARRRDAARPPDRRIQHRRGADQVADQSR